MSKNSSHKWYVMRTGKVQGPFSYNILLKLGRLGRLKPTDKLSHDQEKWRKAASYPALFPSESTPIQLKDDERSGLDRRDELNQTNETVGEHQRQKVDRRSQEAPETIERRKMRTKLLEAINKSHTKDHFPLATIIIAVIVVISLAVMFTPSDEPVDIDCNAPADVGVVWDNCRLSNLSLVEGELNGASIKNADLSGGNFTSARMVKVDFSFSNLNKANFQSANLNNAVLVGVDMQSANLYSVSLRESDLSYADLRGANLKNADLTNALFSKTIWTDGKICAAGSVGECLLEEQPQYKTEPD